MVAASLYFLLLAAPAFARIEPVSREARHERLARDLRARAVETPEHVFPGSLTAEQGCHKFKTMSKYDTCQTVVDTHKGFTTVMFLNANPTVDCNNPSSLIGKAICVAGPSSDLQFGSIDLSRGCLKFYKAKEGDTCQKVVDKFNLSLEEYYALNVGVGDQCQSLWKDYWTCVKGGGETETVGASLKSNHTAPAHVNAQVKTKEPEPTQTSSRAPKKTSSRTSSRTSESHKSESTKSSSKVTVGGLTRDNGRVTFYGQGDGGLACENTPGCSPSDKSMTCAVSSSVYDNGKACGKKVKIYGKQDVELLICDLCPSCPSFHFDLTFSAAEKVMGADWHTIGMESNLKYQLFD